MSKMDPEFEKVVNNGDIQKIIEYLRRGVPEGWLWYSYKPTNALTTIKSYIGQYVTEANVMHKLTEKKISHTTERAAILHDVDPLGNNAQVHYNGEEAFV